MAYRKPKRFFEDSGLDGYGIASFGLIRHDDRLPLTVDVIGEGQVGDDGGIDCGNNCTDSFAYNSSVILTAAAYSGADFLGWSGACSGNQTTCVVDMAGSRDVGAAFTPQFIYVSRGGESCIDHQPCYGSLQIGLEHNEAWMTLSWPLPMTFSVNR